MVMAAAALWGTLGVAFKTLHAAGVSALEFGFWRAAIASSVLVCYLAVARPAQLRIQRADAPLFLVYGGFGVALFYVIYPCAVQLSTVAVAAVLLYTAPAWVALLGACFLAEPLTARRLIAVALTFAGCAVVAQAYDPSRLHANLAGVLAGLGSGFTYAAMSVLGKVSLRRYSAATISAFTLSIGAAFLLPLWLLQGHRFDLWLHPQTIALMLYSGVVPTTLSFLLYTSGLGLLQHAGRASVLATIEPFCAALFAYLILGEAMASAQWCGGAFILCGVYLTEG